MDVTQHREQQPALVARRQVSLLHLAARGRKGNTWAIRLDQPSGEAVQVPEYPAGSMPADGSFAVFTDAATPAPQVPAGDPFAQQQPMARPPFDAITRPAVPARFDGRHVVDMTYKNNNTGFVPGRRTPRTWRPQQLFRQNVGDTTKKQITNVAYSHRGAVVSPDGKWVAFVADARLRPDSVVELERDSLAKLPYDKVRDEAERNDADVYVISVEGGAPRKVVEWMGAESNVTWSPDGKQLAFIGRPGRTKNARLFTVDVNGGTPRNLLGEWQFEPSDFDWLKSGIQFTADIGGRSAVLRADLTGKSAEGADRWSPTDSRHQLRRFGQGARVRGHEHDAPHRAVRGQRRRHG